jgi:hypothetical protein
LRLVILRLLRLLIGRRLSSVATQGINEVRGPLQISMRRSLVTHVNKVVPSGSLIGDEVLHLGQDRAESGVVQRGSHQLGYVVRSSGVHDTFAASGYREYR